MHLSILLLNFVYFCFLNFFFNVQMIGLITQTQYPTHIFAEIYPNSYFILLFLHHKFNFFSISFNFLGLTDSSIDID